MSDSWLHIVGIGEDGLDGLSPASHAALDSAEILIGGERHHRLTSGLQAQRISWPSPFDALTERLRALRHRRVAVLVTGDPLWYSAGAQIGQAFPLEEITYHPHPGAFQMAAARMGWSMADLETLTVHGRPVEQVIPFIQPGARLLILTAGADSPGEIAGILRECGYGRSRLAVLAHMGGPDAQSFTGTANDWHHEVPDFNTLAVECIAERDARILPAAPGLPDDAFQSDGNMTKREIRAATLSRLMPMRGALLWDIGCGSGSVAIEWMRGARGARAIGIEPRADRRALARANARALGAPALKLVQGQAPMALKGLEEPDAVFFGGGLSRVGFSAAWEALRPHGRLVANAVTLETERLLFDLHAHHGGDLTRLAISRVEPIGSRRGWRALMPVTQWSLIKR